MGPFHEGRHGNTERQRMYHQAKFVSRKAKKDYKSVQDRFLRCTICRQSQLNKGCTEEHSKTGRANDFFKNLAKLTTDFILESKFECDQTNQLLGTTKVRSASTQRQAGSDMTLSLQQALLPQGGDRLHCGSLLHGHRHQNGVVFFF